MDKSSTEFEDRRKFMILHINKVCRGEWTKKDEKNGKVIEVEWRNGPIALSVVPLYTEKGWLVTREVMIDKSGKILILRFNRPPKPW